MPPSGDSFLLVGGKLDFPILDGEQMPAEPLSDIEIQRELGGLSGWSRKGSAITKTYQFKTFPEGIAFVDRIAELAESAGHHPDIDIRYTKVTCSLSTHDSGGITQKDFDLARAIEGAETSK